MLCEARRFEYASAETQQDEAEREYKGRKYSDHERDIEELKYELQVSRF